MSTSFFVNFLSRIMMFGWRDPLTSEHQHIRGRAWMLRATCWHEVPKVCWALRSVSGFLTCWIGSKNRCFYFLMIKSIFELRGPASKETPIYRTYSWSFSWDLRPTFRVNPSASRSARSFFLLIWPLLLTGCTFSRQENAWMTTFGMAFVMEPLKGDRPNGSEWFPHYFVIIAERDD